MAGVSGPCPSCGSIIKAPSEGLANNAESNSPLPPQRNTARTKSRSKGRIPVDSIIDHAHLEHRESMKSILVIALFVLAICGCIAATHFLKQWMGR